MKIYLDVKGAGDRVGAFNPERPMTTLRIYTESDASKMTGSKLTNLIAQLRDSDMELCSEMIAAGRGHERSSDTLVKSDGLSQRCKAVRVSLGVLGDEVKRRREWNGTLNRIRSAA